MATTLRFVSPTLADVKAQRVSWKERWADPWTLMSPKLWCNSAQWTASPSLPAAELHWRYGIALEIGQQAFAARFKETNRLRMYVKVEYDTFAIESAATDPLRWYGLIDVELDDFHGAVTRAVGGEPIAFASGKNYFTALGLESLLDLAHVSTSVVAKGDGTVFRVGRAITFNEGGVPNMSPAPGPDGVYTFAASLSGAGTWSSYAIAQYLLKYHPPRDFNGMAMVQFELGGPQIVALTPYDSPVVPAEDKTVRELLNVLLPRQRLTGWSVIPEEAVGGKLVVTPFTMTGVEIPLDLNSAPLWKVDANPLQYRIAAELDRGKEIAVKRSTADAFDQVTVRGARRTSTATFSFYDGTLAKGWSDAQEVEYELGASAAADYPSDVGARMQRNVLARTVAKLRPVYQRFILPPTFQYLVGDGLSGVAATPFTPSDTNPAVPTPIAPLDFRFATELALQEGFDYEILPATELQTPPHRPAKPLVLYPRSDSTPLAPRYRQIDALGSAAELPENVQAGDVWSARPHVDADDGALWVDMVGDLPHLFASADHSRLDADIDPSLLGNPDFRKMLATLTMEWSEYASATYPAAGPPGRDLVRTYVLNAGDEYRLDYLCPQTIVAIVPGTAELVRCAEGGYVRDDREKLMAVARLAYAWYSVTRRVLSYKTSLLCSSLRIGSFITALGDPAVEGDVHTEDVNSVVTSIEVRSPSAEGEGSVRPAVPTIHYETAFGELDWLKFA